MGFIKMFVQFVLGSAMWVVLLTGLGGIGYAFDLGPSGTAALGVLFAIILSVILSDR